MSTIKEGQGCTRAGVPANRSGRGGSQRPRPFGRLAEFGQGLADRGTVTAEYAVATLGACGFAGLLLGLLRSGEVKSLLSGIIKRGLNLG